jgi:hypothetical protein
MSGPAPTNRKTTDRKADRLRAALRENLKRRRAQARERSVAEEAPSTPAHDSAGFGADKQKR